MEIHNLHFTGMLLGVSTFVIIGLFHPLVVKCYYWFGTRCWWWFLVLGLVSLAASLFAESVFVQTLLGVFAFSSFWTIKEIFEQRRRVAKGWFPANPKHQRPAPTETAADNPAPFEAPADKPTDR